MCGLASANRPRASVSVWLCCMASIKGAMARWLCCCSVAGGRLWMAWSRAVWSSTGIMLGSAKAGVAAVAEAFCRSPSCRL